MMSFGFLAQEQSFQVDPKIVQAAQDAQKGEWGAAGAGAGVAVCVATGIGAAAAPLCAAVGNWLGKTFAGALNAVNAGYQEQKAQLAAQDAARDYLEELKRLRDTAVNRTVNGLVEYGKENGWPQANPRDVAVQLRKLGANISPFDYSETGTLPLGAVDTGLFGNGPYFSGPLPCTGPAPFKFLKCTGGSCSPGGKGQYVVNGDYIKCTEDKTNEWAGQLEIAATYLGAAILDRKAPGQINFAGPRFSVNGSKSGLSTTTKVVGGAAALGGGWWLLTKLGWL